MIPDRDEPIGQLSPQEWMAAAETQSVLAALTAEGAEVRFVGGCVRDALLKRSIKDVDIATHDPPEQVLALLEKAGIRAIPTGIAHGTVTAVVGKAHYEITTLREDVETYGRHARVSFTSDWTVDAARRDFTMNAMFADRDGRVYDPFGGMADLSAGRVRFVGNAQKRIEEDVLRLLRFFRFYAHYGRPPMDGAAVAACRRMAPQLANLSGERVAGEVLRLLASPDPAEVLLVMHGEHILDHLLPDAKAFGRLRVLSWLESRAMVRDDVKVDPLRRLAAVLTTDGPGGRRVGERLKLSTAECNRLAALTEPAAVVTAAMDKRTTRRTLRHFGPELVRDLVLLAWAEARSLSGRTDHAETTQWKGLLDAAAGWEMVMMPVRGQDCLDLGLAQGKEIGPLLAAVERWWEDNDYRPDREACLTRLREVAGSSHGMMNSANTPHPEK